nr:retrovirus-related Pol polyprotein from transposon TNT 1-94 [Tanacetum cinerariifolium]
MSSVEAEYVSLSMCCAQVIWMRTQLTDYGFHFDKIPMYCDSKAVIAISYNPIQHSRTKHIDVKYHFIKEKVKKGIVELFFVGTEYQLADLFTKALPEERFKYLVRRLGMRCLTPDELERSVRFSALTLHIEENSSIIRLSPYIGITSLPISCGLQALSNLHYLFGGFMDYLWSRELNISNFGPAYRTMATTIEQQVVLDEALVPGAQRLRIGRSNFRLPSDIQSKESTLNSGPQLRFINTPYDSKWTPESILSIWKHLGKCCI